MKRLTLLVALALWLGTLGTGYAKSDAEKMNEGNEAYRAGNWPPAIELYSSVPASNADLFYNRANAHFKNKEIGKAILYYNRALRIKPRDKEIRANLEYARLSRTDKTEKEKKSTAVKMAEALFTKISMNEHAAAAMAIFTVLAGLLFGVIYLPEGGLRSKLKTAAVIAAVVLAFQLTVTGIKTYNERVIQYGVVTVKETAALSSPASGSRKVFELHDGAEVKLGRRESGYIQVALPTGWTGWLPFDAVTRV
ncbi:MAG: tetratricopeptide repeat protein [Nitrospinota bacterium]